MNNITESFLKKLDALPELLDINDLISLGLYDHKNGAYRARRNGNSPSYIKMPHKILYPKDAVRSFILERFHDGSMPKEVQPAGEISE